MKKGKKIFLWFFVLIIVVILGAGVFVYSKVSVNTEFIQDKVLKEETSIILPKSDSFKVTSTAKGDNQSKLARLNDEVFTFYLDNSNCTDPTARGNDKIMQLIRIKADGKYEIFDSIPVWMHGNALVDEEAQRIYYTTYEEVFLNNQYISSVKIYTYQLNNGNLQRTNVHTLADDSVIPFEANPRVGADIDENGNIAVAFSNYTGVMFVHIYDKSNDLWIKHSIEYYHDTYQNDCNLYPYVKLDGINTIKVVANRDTSIRSDGTQYKESMRDYTRYFSYNGSEWYHKIIADVRNKDPEGTKGLSAAPLCLYLDKQKNSHIVTKEDNKLHYYKINQDNKITKMDLPKLNATLLLTFVRIIEIKDKLYYVVSGDGIKGFQRTGYVEIYDFSTKKLLYRNNSVCKTPYLYLSNDNDSNYIDIEVISRDKKYKENSDTHYIKLKIL